MKQTDAAVTYKDGEFMPLLSPIRPEDPHLLKFMNALVGTTLPGLECAADSAVRCADAIPKGV